MSWREEYRNDVRDVVTEGRWTFWKIFPSILLIVLVIGGIGAGTRYLGMWGGTVMERVIFTESYQRSSALTERIAVDEAVLTEITRKLNTLDIDDNTRANLEAQAAAARVRIATARSQQ